MEDDERAVDWAPRKIRELQAGLGEVMGSLRILERNTAENGRRLAALEGRDDTFKRPVDEKKYPKQHWPTEGRWVPTLVDEEAPGDVPLERWIGEALGAVSVCWEPRPSGTFDSTRAKWIADSVIARVDEVLAEARAPKPNRAEATRRTVIELAEKRIRDYMDGHFSEGTIGGVVRALKGVPAIPPIAEYDDRKNSER